MQLTAPQLQDGYNVVVSPIYWCTLIIFGSFFLVNLVLAVLFGEFSNTQVRRAAAPREAAPQTAPQDALKRASEELKRAVAIRRERMERCARARWEC